MAGKHIRKKPKKSIGRIVAVTVLILVLAAGGLWLGRETLFAPTGGGSASAVGTTRPVAVTTTTAASTTAPTVTQPSVDQPPIPSAPEKQPAVFARPEEMRGVWLRAGVDYRLKDTDSGETVKKQLDEAFVWLKAGGWNTVLLPLEQNTAPLTADGQAFDPVAYALRLAREQELYVYGVLDLHVGDEDGWDPALDSGMTAVMLQAKWAAQTYAMDGFLLENYSYAYGAESDDTDYQLSAAKGASFEEWRAARLEQAVMYTAWWIRHVNANAYVGLLTNAVWAHSTSAEGGSDTASVYEEWIDGHADAPTWLKNGLVDFVMVKDYVSTVGRTVNFNKILDWWAALCDEMDKPLYIAHAADKVGGEERGWSALDQLAKQALACRKAAGWQGSAFCSLSALRSHADSTAAMLAALDGTLMEEYISRELAVTEPADVSYTTMESTLNLRGSADPNFPLTMNGQPVALTEHGFFSLDQTLQAGENRFMFDHKGKTVTYTVTYKVQVLKSVAPSSAVTLDGGTTITLSAVAHKGSAVYAMLGGTKVPMKVSALQMEEGTGDDLSDYENYVGSYTLPAGIIGKTQSLGAVTVHARYQSLSESKNGGSITVKALPEPSKPSEPNMPEVPSDLLPVDPATGGKTLKNGTVMIITADHAETFSGDTIDDYSRPTNAYLPKGTTDVYVKSVYDAASDHTYYLLGCGRRVYDKDATVYRENGSLSANTLTCGEVTVNGKGTVLRFDSNWRVPYQLQLLPQTYDDPEEQNYRITAQTTEYIDITFYYTTDVKGVPDVSASPLFRSAEWRTAGDARVLRLNLTRTAQFYGYTVGWDNDGTLTFAFKHPASLKGNTEEQPLTGFTVVLDAGHGGNSIGTSGGKVAEKTIALAYTQEVREQLEALGATVVMTRTDDSALSLEERVVITRKAGADLFISIHMDGSTSSSVHGCSVHYFNEYSMLPAKLVYQSMNEVYKAAGAASSRGYKWNPFYVTRLHDAPAMLIECGFMTNAGDLERLIDAGFRERLAVAIADGVVAYAATLPALQ